MLQLVEESFNFISEFIQSLVVASATVPFPCRNHGLRSGFSNGLSQLLTVICLVCDNVVRVQLFNEIFRFCNIVFLSGSQSESDCLTKSIDSRMNLRC